MVSSDEWLWLDAREAVGVGELSCMCGISEADVQELVEYGSLEMLQEGRFQADVVAPLREAMRVRARFDLDLFTAGLVLQYLRRIDRLEHELRALRTAHGT
jgi:chaperone modulatory protein CbpM